MCNGSGKRLRFNFAVLFVVIYCCLASCMVLVNGFNHLLAVTKSAVVSSANNLIAEDTAVSWLAVGNNSVNKTILSCNNNGTLSFNSSVYAMLDIDKKDTFMEASLSAVSKSGLGVVYFPSLRTYTKWTLIFLSSLKYQLKTWNG